MANPWLSRRVLNYAHQGGALEAPSSTLYALHRALRVGATALELDAHLTADDQLVLAHDGTVDRLTDGTGAINALTLAELRKLDAAYHFAFEEKPGAFPFRGRAPADPELRIPTLDEVLEAFPRTFLNLDIKAGEEKSEACALALARALLARNRDGDFIVASFDDSLTEAFSRAAPGIATSVGMSAAMAIWQAVHEGKPLPPISHLALQLPAQFQDTAVVTAELVGRAHEAGIAVHVWTVNEASEMERLCELGVDGLITDRPSLCAQVLESRGVTYRG